MSPFIRVIANVDISVLCLCYSNPTSCILCVSPPSSSTSNIRLRLNHPWLTIIHPGPWTQLPAAPPPARSLRSQHRPRVSAPNPFERVDEEAKPQKAAANQVGKGTSAGGVSNPAMPSPVKPHGRSDEIVAGVAHKSGNRKEALTGDARAGITQSQQPNLPRSLSVPAITCSIPPPERPKVGRKCNFP